MDLLEEKKVHLPSILQSLGCIAQIAMPIFETREEEIVNFITKKILECNNVRLNLFNFSLLFPFYSTVNTILIVSRIWMKILLTNLSGVIVHRIVCLRFVKLWYSRSDNPGNNIP